MITPLLTLLLDRAGSEIAGNERRPLTLGPFFISDGSARPGVCAQNMYVLGELRQMVQRLA